MKKTFLFLALFSAHFIYAQDFKPYGIESGKIEYEKLRYSIHAGFKTENGVETSFRELIPYVSEQVIYYWGDFGDKAFEEIYQVSAFGGKLLPEKVKTGERLWIDDHRYYFDAEKNIVYDDPFHVKIECRENFQYYQITGSWIKCIYKGAENKGKVDFLGQEVDYYEIDRYQDLYAWKGLLVKDESFATSGMNGPRSDIDRAKVAVKIDTLTEIDEGLFEESIWLKRQKYYESFDGFKIVELLDANPNLFTQADNKKGIEIKKNDIIFFITSSLKVGKMQVLDIDTKNTLNIKFDLFSFNNELESYRESYTLENSSLLEIDMVSIETEKSRDVDFLWERSKNSNLFPQNNIGIYILNSSRTNDFKL